PKSSNFFAFSSSVRTYAVFVGISCVNSPSFFLLVAVICPNTTKFSIFHFPFFCLIRHLIFLLNLLSHFLIHLFVLQILILFELNFLLNYYLFFPNFLLFQLII